MDTLDHNAFETVKCQAGLFTPSQAPALGPIIRDLVPAWKEIFDGEPSFPLAVGSDGVAQTRVILSSKGHDWRCEISPARIDVYWEKPADDKRIELARFFDQAIEILLQYKQTCRKRAGRLVALTTRVVMLDKPGLFLARHFCKKRWSVAPLNRPESVEFHAHKRFRLPSGLTVNSWVRNKTGRMSKGEESEMPIILVSQDINTLPEELETADFDDAQCRRFFAESAKELEVILGLYYPVTAES